jgi:two-component system CheB/CheR fusion protein
MSASPPPIHHATEPEDGSVAPRFVVGIGASAGGLESLESLFRHMPTRTGMAFVVIQHLSPDFKSMMGELLARDTSMRIVVVEDGCRVEADTIYLMPPKKQMIIAEGRLHLSDKDPSRSALLPIDHFLASLARESGRSSVAIILSGSGTDGTRGIEEVARRGGLVLCESLDTARFDGMPSSAQATGLVDIVLAPSEMGATLVAHAEHPSGLPRGARERDEASSLKGIDAIFQMFRSHYDIDFSSYRETTVMRRIGRRLEMLGVDSLDRYAEAVLADPAELHALYRDLLIGVTQFFRDPGAFELLRTTVGAEILGRRGNGEPLRAWVAGCATGEEAYSVAIALQEAMRLAGRSLPLKVFATDVHKRSIEQASRGVYALDALDGVDEEVRDRYFVRCADRWQVAPETRQMIVYARHNVLRDAPFTGLDLVTCRNLLIYLKPAAQRRAISLFHYGLRVGGVLMLGGSESTGELASEFDTISERHRVFRKSREVRLNHNLRSPLTSADALAGGVSPLSPVRRPAPGSLRSRQVHDALLDRFMPPSILIDASRSVIDTFGGAEKLLRFPSREPTLDVLDLVERDLRATLSGAIGRAIKSQAKVRFGKLQIDTDAGQQAFDLTVDPVGDKAEETCYLITLAPLETSVSASSESGHAEAARETGPAARSRVRIQQLEEDLRHSRQNQQATIEELETSNEELQATNEELIASNEELQSTNEELHSLNEELYSVNAEHQRKIEQLAELNRDMTHLLENTDVATVFLDGDLRIRRFTSRVREVFDLIDEDVGRPIQAFGSKLRNDDLTDRLRDVLVTGRPFEREVASSDGTVYLMRLLPYRPDDRVSGVVMMWIDVSSLDFLRGRVQWLSAIVESTSDAIIGLDPSGTITSWNRGAEQLYGYAASEVQGRHIGLLIPSDRVDSDSTYRERVLRGETVQSLDTVRLRKGGNPIHVSLTVSPVFNAERHVIGISKIARDVSQRIELQEKLLAQMQQRERFLATLSHELRNPLNAVSTAASVLSGDQASVANRQSAAAAIRRQVGMLSHLLEDLLDVARIAEDRISLDFAILDLRELSSTVQEVLQLELDRHGCEVEFLNPPDPVLVNGDRTRLVQIQVNLIHNAAKYSGTTSPIRVGIEAIGGQAHLWVADDGRGIPPDRLEAIFEPFAQLNSTHQNGEGGLGIGLTLTRSLVELHGGRVVAESAGKGLGAVFHVWLPLASDAPEALPVGAPGERVPIGGGKQNAPAPTLRVCVVEDLDDSREMIKMLLELDGHSVKTAADGATAIDVLTNDPPDLALIDIGLPDVSGYDVVRRLRTQLPETRTRLVALTGYGQTSDVAEAFEAGFDGHIVKPLDPEQLQQLCRRVASGGNGAPLEGSGLLPKS